LEKVKTKFCDVSSKYNWGNISFTIDGDTNCKFEINKTINFNQLNYIKLNSLIDNYQINTKGIVTKINDNITPKQIQIQTKSGSCWIKFWNEELIKEIKINNIYSFIGFFSKLIGKNQDNKNIFILNSSKFSRIIEIIKN
jgi:hypothetical protein